MAAGSLLGSGLATTDLLKWAGSMLAVMAFLRGILPRDAMDYIFDRVVRFASPWSYFLIEEYDGYYQNELYTSVKTYLGSLTSERALVSYLTIRRNTHNVSFSMAGQQRIHDDFDGVHIEWLRKVSSERRPMPFQLYSSGNASLFEMRVRRAYKNFVLENYITHITSRAAELKRSDRPLQLYSNRKSSSPEPGRVSRSWFHIPFKHPTTFETLAMDPELKASILKDLNEFIGGRDFYEHVGKAWKRGYLLYGPPGTGKTSIVAAMANMLGYDIYDLELTEVQSNSELRNLLVYTESKSIIVIEDIDCSMDLSGKRKKKPPKSSKTVEQVVQDKDGRTAKSVQQDDESPSSITLSGLLNFLDGLWSCCENERIFVFTTNYVDKLDEALLRSGRMDMHISLGYIKLPAFTQLVERVFGVNHHETFSKVEELLEKGARMAPADVSEILLRHRDDLETAMKEAIEALEDRLAHPPPPEVKPARLMIPPSPKLKDRASDAEEEEKVKEPEAKGSESPESQSPQENETAAPAESNGKIEEEEEERKSSKKDKKKAPKVPKEVEKAGAKSSRELENGAPPKLGENGVPVASYPGKIENGSAQFLKDVENAAAQFVREVEYATARPPKQENGVAQAVRKDENGIAPSCKKDLKAAAPFSGMGELVTAT